MLKKSGVLEKHYDLHRFLALQCNIGFINMCVSNGSIIRWYFNVRKNVCERETSVYLCAEFNAPIVNRSVIEWRYEAVKYCTLRLCNKISTLMALFPRCV